MAGEAQRSPRADSATVCTVAFVTLLALKLADVIGWSWWLVTLPLWGQLAIPVLWLGLLLGGAAARPREMTGPSAAVPAVPAAPPTDAC
jgi:hypothetical protein